MRCNFNYNIMVSKLKSLQVNLPDVCAASLEKGKAFCSDHYAFLSKELPDVPLDLHKFLSYCDTEGAKCHNT